MPVYIYIYKKKVTKSNFLERYISHCIFSRSIDCSILIIIFVDIEILPDGRKSTSRDTQTTWISSWEVAKTGYIKQPSKKNKKKGQSKKESQVSGVEEQATIIKRYVLLSFDITFNDLYNIIWKCMAFFQIHVIRNALKLSIHKGINSSFQGLYNIISKILR